MAKLRSVAVGLGGNPGGADRAVTLEGAVAAGLEGQLLG